MRRLAVVSLYAGLAVPVFYFGSQALAAPFFPDFSVLRHTASLLGSDLSSRPGILNAGAAATGLLSLFASLGPVLALRSSGRLWVGLVLSLCLLYFGLASLWAATFLLPDPRHDPGALGIGLFVAPFAALVAAFALRLASGIRWYSVANVAAIFVVAASYAGLITVDLSEYAGLLQRVGTALMLVPSAVIGHALIARAMPSRTTHSGAA